MSHHPETEENCEINDLRVVERSKTSDLFLKRGLGQGSTFVPSDKYSIKRTAGTLCIEGCAGNVARSQESILTNTLVFNPKIVWRNYPHGLQWICGVAEIRN